LNNNNYKQSANNHEKHRLILRRHHSFHLPETRQIRPRFRADSIPEQDSAEKGRRSESSADEHYLKQQTTQENIAA